MANVFMNGGLDGFSSQEIEQTIKDRHRHNQMLNTTSDVTFKNADISNNLTVAGTIQTTVLDMQNHTINKQLSRQMQLPKTMWIIAWVPAV